MPLESNEHENDASDTGNSEATDQRSEAQPQVPPTISPPDPPQPPATPCNPDKKASKWRENAKMGFELFGLVILTAYTVFSCLQWLQIRWTNRLTREALSHSESTLNQTTVKMQGQIDATNSLYGEAQKQTRDADTMATNSSKQATATTAAADAAKRAADIANETLHISERAYLVIGAPSLDLDSLVVSIPILNVGHIPSGAVQITAHEATLEASSGEPPTKRDPMEAKMMRFAHRSIGPSQSSPEESINIPVPKIIAQDFIGNKQQIIIAGTISYNSGFADDPTKTELFCSAGLYFASLKKVSWAGCDPAQYIAEITEAEAKMKK
jgi:hypothetical protein